MSGAYGPEIHLPFVTPAEDLVAAAEIDYTPYRRESQRLYEKHPLFEERPDFPEADLEALAAETLMLPSMLQEIDSEESGGTPELVGTISKKPPNVFTRTRKSVTIAFTSGCYPSTSHTG